MIAARSYDGGVPSPGAAPAFPGHPRRPTGAAPDGQRYLRCVRRAAVALVTAVMVPVAATLALAATPLVPAALQPAALQPAALSGCIPGAAHRPAGDAPGSAHHHHGEIGTLASGSVGGGLPSLRLQSAVASRLAAGETVHLRMVVILAEFADRPAERALRDEAYYEDLLFSRGTHPTGSMADYFLENSGGRVVLDGDVHGWFRMPERYDTYLSGQAGLGTYPYNSQGMVEDAVRAADRSINYAHFDNDGADAVPDTFDDDRFVDLLLVIHAGPGGETAGGRNLRSIAFALPVPTAFDGVFANEFAIAPEDANLGVYAHETAHLFGLPDLYDMTGGSFGLGTWSLMAGGWSLDEARTPAHLDAWCKAQIGFATPVNVATTLTDVRIDPVETGGTIHRLASGGRLDREYFLTEVRRRVGFDRFLPGDGLLIYHVNEGRPTNNIPLNYRVAVEQADGLYQLENLENGPSFGDAGDLWTETSPSRGFGRFTLPDSRLQNGEETGVTVYHIRGPDPEGRITADFRVTIGPAVRIESLALDPIAGDGDGYAEAGETIAIRPQLIISGGTAHGVALRVTSANPLVKVLNGAIDIGDLPVGTHSLTDGFHVTVGDELPANPYGADFQLEIDYQDEVPLSRGLTVALGDEVGLVEDFGTTTTLWPHRAGRIGFYDLWRLEQSGGPPTPGNGANPAWHCGNPTLGFRGGTDAILETPLFILPPSAHLIVDHLMETPRSDSNEVIAGGFVEISLNGGDWTQITPTRGYNRIYFGTDDFMKGRWILTQENPLVANWETLDFDLSQMSGGARLRFRFFSANTVFIGRGWWLDNLRIQSGGTPIALSRFTAHRGPAGAELEWTLVDAAEASGLNVYRADPAGEEKLNVALLAPASEGRFVDAAPPEGGTRYRLEAVERGGGVRTLGSLWLDPAVAGGTAAAPSIHCAPNPSPGATRFSLLLPRAAAVRLNVFDARGRRVQTLLDEWLPDGAHEIVWDGRDVAGQSVPAGLYFYRLDTGGRSVSRKVVISR